MIKKILLALILLPLCLVLFAFYFMFFTDRPPLSIDPAVLAGDGSTLNYCELPTLDGSGKLATDIPKGNTPGCAYDHFPLPVLSECTEPLVNEAADIRGLWIGVKGKHTGHVERVEACGNRVVVTASGVIHDMGPNSTAGTTSNDTEGSVLFTMGEKEYCGRTSAGVVSNEGVLDFHVLGWGPVVVRRYRDGEQLVWEYADGSVTHMDRICRLPEAQKIPQPRGPRYKVF